MTERETEFKFLLTPADYTTLLSRLGSVKKTREFINRYYTVSDAGERKDWVLRLRIDESGKELTLKVGREVAPGVFDSTEYTAMVQGTEPLEWEDTEPLIVLRREISKGLVEVQGESRNRRLIFEAPIDVGDLWELDRTQLPGDQSFCELEVEVSFTDLTELERDKRLLTGWLEECGISAETSSKTKYARFLQALTQNC